MTRKRVRTFGSDVADGAAVVSLVVSAVGYATGSLAVIVIGLVVVALALLGLRFALHPPNSLGVVERRQVGRFLERELDRFRQERLPAGCGSESGITLEDFLSVDELFAEPKIEIKNGNLDVTSGFTSWLMDAVAAGGRVLVLGDPGQGKTLSCRLAYCRLVRAYQRSPRRSPLPLFVRLVDVREHVTAALPSADPKDGLA